MIRMKKKLGIDLPNMMDDKKLVAAILQGNEKTLRLFYLHFAPRIASFIHMKVADPKDAEEILQDVLLASIEALRDFSFRSTLFTFVCSIANHKVIDYYRRKKIKKVVFSQIPEAESLFSTLLGPESNFDEQVLREKIKKTFEKLTPQYRYILKMKYIYGYTVEEIAKKLSISFKSAESQLFRARKAFVFNYNI
jgi:RNA polymerase sigma-70 factor, ECF subfamily